MRIPLSKRLLACCNYISPGDRVADIGCDHGYLGIHLLTQGIASSVIAADVNEGPLQSAMRNAAKFGVRDKMAFYLSDGVRNIPREFDVMVCAGMGADTMVSILEAAPWLKSSNYRLVLQCQSKTPMLRQYLSENGWRIMEESVLRDGRFLYTVMDAEYRPEHPRLSVGEYYFPPALLENPAKELPEYYHRLLFSLRRAVTNQKENADPQMAAALKELETLTDDPALDFLKEENHDNGQ
ncbi:MAG: SAM-dependent methyltransferase [Oscillospiraceae bacterium]|nr:SAM-dependent methyltransferase [Oscillospiraceae bacterium]